ncbi:unnamed protein product [Arabis nemorensis]|uniref:Uncharacterized protein n=1 Tax=Arabis nemorensis TaxID=586526 RepID=A0A565BUN7_9BRAS|nr:unnamed protein product [Arabis nemorensis]
MAGSLLWNDGSQPVALTSRLPSLCGSKFMTCQTIDAMRRALSRSGINWETSWPGKFSHRGFRSLWKEEHLWS